MSSINFFIAILLTTILFQSSTYAKETSCNYYLILSDIDGRYDLTSKVIDEVFLKKGYTVTKIKKITSDLPKNFIGGQIFSDIHKSFGARSHIEMYQYKHDSSKEIVREKIYDYNKKIESKWYDRKSSEDLLISDIAEDLPPCNKLPALKINKTTGLAPALQENDKVNNSPRDFKDINKGNEAPSSSTPSSAISK